MGEAKRRRAAGLPPKGKCKDSPLHRSPMKDVTYKFKHPHKLTTRRMAEVLREDVAKRDVHEEVEMINPTREVGQSHPKRGASENSPNGYLPCDS